MKTVILENIRSAYNVGNIIRTADALWRHVRLAWYTPDPDEQPKVKKTSLWAEEHVGLKRFDNSQDAMAYAKENNIITTAAEVTNDAVDLSVIWEELSQEKSDGVAVIFGNEVDGVLEETLESVDKVIYIPMNGIKESLNVWQTSAMFMWELGKFFK